VATTSRQPDPPVVEEAAAPAEPAEEVVEPVVVQAHELGADLEGGDRRGAARPSRTRSRASIQRCGSSQ
jgi:hypothetical protein